MKSSKRRRRSPSSTPCTPWRCLSWVKEILTKLVCLTKHKGDEGIVGHKTPLNGDLVVSLWQSEPTITSTSTIGSWKTLNQLWVLIGGSTKVVCASSFFPTLPNCLSKICLVMPIHILMLPRHTSGPVMLCIPHYKHKMCTTWVQIVSGHHPSFLEKKKDRAKGRQGK